MKWRIYPEGTGDFGARVDAPSNAEDESKRVVSFICDISTPGLWTPAHGATFHVYDSDSGEVLQQFPPMSGSLLLFDSRKVLHEVTPMAKPGDARVSLVGWMYEASYNAAAPAEAEACEKPAEGKGNIVSPFAKGAPANAPATPSRLIAAPKEEWTADEDLGEAEGEAGEAPKVTGSSLEQYEWTKIGEKWIKHKKGQKPIALPTTKLKPGEMEGGMRKPPDLGKRAPWAKPPGSRRQLQAASSEELWHRSWKRSLECWWLALPAPTQSQLGACLGALSLHFGARLDSFLGRAAKPHAVDAGCEWVSQSAGTLQMPDFPDANFKFNFPPIPALVPQWEHLRSHLPAGEATAWLSASLDDEPLAYHSPVASARPATSVSSSTAMGAAAGAAVGVALSVFALGMARAMSAGGGRVSLHRAKSDAPQVVSR